MITAKTTTMSANDIKAQIKQINSRLDYLKMYHSNGDENPWGWGTVREAKRNLRDRKKALQEQLKSQTI